MELDRYVDDIARHLAVAADASGPEARQLAELLTLPLHAAIRLALLDALAAATEELTVELAPGSVELRLRGGEPSFAVQGVSATPSAADPDPAIQVGSPSAGSIDAEFARSIEAGIAGSVRAESAHDPHEGQSTRINLRMPDTLKIRVEAAALREGRSVNAWLVRAASAALDSPAAVQPSAPSAPAAPAHRTAKRVTGWAR